MTKTPLLRFLFYILTPFNDWGLVDPPMKRLLIWWETALARRGWFGKQQGFFTHLHHANRVPVEWEEDVRLCLRFIETYPRKKERRLRLALLRRVPESLLPKELLAAQKAADEAFRAWRSAPGIYNNVVEPMEEARLKKEAAWKRFTQATDWDTLHRKICHPRCPWTTRKPDIFSKGKTIRVLKD